VFFFQILADSMDDRLIAEFIGRWAKSGGAERANYQLFLAELCEALDVARPEPTVEDDSQNAYVFERNVQFDNLDGTYSTCRIDLYKRGCFVLESKQGVEQQETAPALSAKQQQRRAKRKRGHGTRGTAGWDDAMFRARGQAEQYTRALPPDEGRPPFVSSWTSAIRSNCTPSSRRPAEPTCRFPTRNRTASSWIN
jgi:hypothetical protein